MTLLYKADPIRGAEWRFSQTKIVFSVGAGVDQFDLAALPDHVPLVRMLDPGIAEGSRSPRTIDGITCHAGIDALPDFLRPAISLSACCR